jgi:hypothetical protein
MGISLLGGRTTDSTTFADKLGDIDCCAGKTAPCCDGMLVTMFGIPTEADGSTESCIDRLTSRECEKNPSGTNKKNLLISYGILTMASVQESTSDENLFNLRFMGRQRVLSQWYHRSSSLSGPA